MECFVVGEIFVCIKILICDRIYMHCEWRCVTPRLRVPPQSDNTEFHNVKGITMYTENYKLFRAPRNRHLRRKTWIAHTIWNYNVISELTGIVKQRASLGITIGSVSSGSPQPTKQDRLKRHTKVIKPREHLFNMIGPSLKNSEVHVPLTYHYLRPNIFAK